MSIVFGAKYRDKITGFEGIATAASTYISGCSQVLLTAQVGPDGEIKSHWFDEQRMEPVVGAARITLDNGDTPGCDIEAPKR
jgi:hypothetical protein